MGTSSSPPRPRRIFFHHALAREPEADPGRHRRAARFFTPDFRLFADASGVRKGGSGLHGDICNAQVGLEYFPLRSVGVALACGATGIDPKRDDPGLTRFRVKLQGPTPSLKARF